MLYLPKFFWHQVHSEGATPGDLNIAVNFWFTPSYQLPFCDCRIQATIVRSHRALRRVYHSLPVRSLCKVGIISRTFFADRKTSKPYS
jgi:hypothetical protein